MYRFTTTILILTVALSSQLANADPASDALSVTVNFTDLDLTRNADVAVLYQRLKGAAQMVCAPIAGQDLGRQMRFKQCIHSALGTAVAKVDQPALTAYYRGQFKVGKEPTQIAQK
jgi:UrcA family protein